MEWQNVRGARDRQGSNGSQEYGEYGTTGTLFRQYYHKWVQKEKTWQEGLRQTKPGVKRFMHGVSDHGESSLEVSGNNMHVRRRWPSRELEAAGFEQFRANSNVFQCP